MKKLVVILFMVLLSVGCVRQNKPDATHSEALKYKEGGENRIFTRKAITDTTPIINIPSLFPEFALYDDQLPVFPGGEEALNKFLLENIIYPVSARKANIEGKVYTSFVIDTNGKVGEIKIINGLSNDINKEVIRVISIMPNWVPGFDALHNRKLRMQMFLPVIFNLDNGNLQNNNNDTDTNIMK